MVALLSYLSDVLSYLFVRLVLVSCLTLFCCFVFVCLLLLLFSVSVDVHFVIVFVCLLFLLFRVLMFSSLNKFSSVCKISNTCTKFRKSSSR